MTSKISHEHVEQMLQSACDEGNRRLKNGEAKYSDISSRNEDFMVSALHFGAQQVGLKPDLISHLGGKAFPDVHILGSQIGIELKGSRRGGAITGNSIFSGSMVDNLKKVFLFYWIDDREPKLGFRDYFDCVFDAKVTHSPRFALQVDLPEDGSMFGDQAGQLGFTAADWLSGEKRYVDKIVREIRQRALERDEIPWWVYPDSGEGLSIEPDVADGFGGLRNLKQIGSDLSCSIQKTLFLGFPEVLSGGKAAHSNAIGWAISRKSAIVGRDVFSAGGKRDVNLGGGIGTVTLPAVVHKCSMALHKSCAVSLADLSEIHGQEFSKPENVIANFAAKITGNESLEYLHEHLSVSKRRIVNPKAFVSALAKYLVSQIDPQTLR